ncbi:DNA protecting protein DprA [candidate division WOR-1 bacterium RIFCSPHIGHO2_01_FULL_53_15]|uniref:DNA protecting protein DprA n=1 Tax=candidate division WOR-1 bacterium RIFCSPHIGHO2_01_FULL_53_15 TaxID=1802564 RepID=A0A1F4PZQ6_UNCSA|nr:MAG: DNA protecting protein DprA [candidate division WOR-1 bacterium RIFCSPHIGHO2_01_FULL_53_15]OGC10661.1 MAG: DNA protecting protein DprA [candidate division WOR-1 bacterium RIFCSPHIGHO2_02_FULL_53_26]
MNEDLKYWLAINKIPGLGAVTINKLWGRFESIEAVWRADEKDIFAVEGINRTAAAAFIQSRGQLDPAAELAEVEKQRVSILTLADKNYPKNLKNIYDPPPVLYVKGDLLPSDGRSLAIVGTRRASRYGLETAKKFAGELAALGMTIVSGLASGIDTAAHQGALEANGRTIAVFGCGVDVIYPPHNKEMSREIESRGALVSEFPMGARGEKGNFPRRNRIISGLSLGVIVVEGHYDSGAMITAKAALEQGREVFAVPGNVGLEQSKGPHWLIKQGAKLVETVEDVLEELNIQLQTSNFKTTNKSQTPKTRPANLTPEEAKIYDALTDESKHLDSVAAEAGLPVHQASSLLMMLEIKKAVRQLPGKYYTTA